MKVDKVIYTAIFGDKDNLQPIPKLEDYDYLVFTDNKELTSSVYQVVLCPPLYEDPTRNARRYKVLSHEVLSNYRYSIWMDSNITMHTLDVNALLDCYLARHDIALHAHPYRDCIYDEASTCMKLGKDSSSVIERQMERYRAEGYPKRNGLVSAGIIYRRHTSTIAKLNTCWWKEIEAHSRRDQLSFNYVTWKHGIEYFVIEGHVRKQNVEGFSIGAHKKRRDYRYW
ncbi:MAG: glycosyltransferase domain-containing protein [Candidatus Binatia bacterium]